MSDIEMPEGYIIDYMILVLAGYDFSKYDWVKDNLDVIHFTIQGTMKSYESYVERIITDRMTSKTGSGGQQPKYESG